MGSQLQDVCRGVASPGLQSVERAITLLQVLSDRGPTRVTDLASELGVHKSNVSRLLSTLERRGVVDRTSDGARYVLGNGIALLAAGAARPRSLAGLSRAAMVDLGSGIGETVNVNVLTNDGHVLTVDQVVGSIGVIGFDWLGQRSLAIATSAGKSLLAYLPGDRMRSVLPRRFPRLTPRTLDRQSLLDQLVEIRVAGVAPCRDELEIGLSAVAVPIFDHGSVVASLSVSGPTDRIFGKKHADIVNAVMRAGERMSIRAKHGPGGG